jgi:hypothetical protein
VGEREEGGYKVRGREEYMHERVRERRGSGREGEREGEERVERVR